MDGGRFRVNQRVVEAVVLVFRKRAIQVIALAVVHATRRRGGPACPLLLQAGRVRGADTEVGPYVRTEASIPPRRAKHLGPVDRLGEDNRADGVVKVQMVLAD